MNAKDNRDFILNLLEIYDSYRYKEVKKKIVITNKEEMNIDF